MEGGQLHYNRDVIYRRDCSSSSRDARNSREFDICGDAYNIRDAKNSRNSLVTAGTPITAGTLV
jgi:hypothetical protein